MTNNSSLNGNIVLSQEQSRSSHHGPKVFWLGDLGPEFKIEKTEDWQDCRGSEKSYGQMIRAKRSRDIYRNETCPITGLTHDQHYMPSNLYKYSETQLGLYLKDHQRIWKDIAWITGEDFSQGFDWHEEDFIFPISKFSEVKAILDFRTKRRVTEEQKEELRERIKEARLSRLEVQTKNPNKNDVSLNTNLQSSNEGDEIIRQ